MRKGKLIAIIVAAILITNAIQLFVQYKTRVTVVGNLNTEILTLERTIEDIGPIETVYTTTAVSYPGQEITEDDIVEQSMPSSFICENYVRNAEELIGNYFKIALTPGTPITTDTIMTYKLDDSLREVDITGNRWPVGLKTGDYVDFRITYPYGEDFIVLSHLRIENITEQSLKVYMTEAQQHYYQACLVDYYLNKEKGADIYLNKYVEPGIQKEAICYYSIPKNIEAIMLLDPNIVDKAQASVNADVRSRIESILNSVSDTDGGTLAGGRSEHNGKINNDYVISKTDDGEEDSEELKDPVASSESAAPSNDLVTDSGVVS